MTFRIHSPSPEIKRELERKLAELAGQVDDAFEYEITAQSLSRDEALESAEGAAEQLGANSIFLAAGLFPIEHAEKVEEEDPDFAIGLPNVEPERRTAGDGCATQQPQHTAEGGCATQEPEIRETPVEEVQSPRIDAQKIRDAAFAKASQARATLQRAGERTASSLKAAGERTGEFMLVAEACTARTVSAAKVVGGNLRSRLYKTSERWKTSFAAWNAQLQERRRIESEARKERQRAAHREAELAAISAQIMLERQKSEEKTRLSAEHPPRPIPNRVAKPVLRKIEPEERDSWPVWRNAFVAAACLALIGVFLLAGNGKTSATPATSSELSRPAKIVPAHTVEKSKPVATQAVTPVPQSAPDKPAARGRVASVSRDDSDGFAEVTVRNYTIAPPKKNAKGVVQITDEE